MRYVALILCVIGYVSGQWGGYLTGLYGVEYGDFAAVVGPVYNRGIWQLYAGAGMLLGETNTWLADVGLRVKLFSVVNVSVSCKVNDGYLAPMLGIALKF